ncbi:MAG TPA: STN domain-containing protein, partial [Tahibacter sp.]|nr:STN domain-containing protein [Tahibacter sp.]
MKPIRNPMAASCVPDTNRLRCGTWRLRQSARCLFAVSMSFWLLPPLAFTAAAQTAAPAQSFSVAAGDLKQALYQFGEQSSLQIVYAPELVQGRTTPGVSGSHSPAQALQRLLAGTGLVAESVNASTVVLKKAPQEQPPRPPKNPETSAPPPTELEKVVVTGSRLPQASMEGPQQVKLYSSADIARSGQK